MSDYGWTDYIDQTGKPCVYCGEPSTFTLVVEGDQYKSGELVKRGKRVGVCNEHKRVAEDLPESLTFRRRGAKGVDQLGMDVGDNHGKRRGAIYGNEAA